MNETGEKLPEALTTPSAPKEEEIVVPQAEDLNGNDNEEPIDDVALEMESDGDIFWLIQRVLWGILKLVVVLGVIGGVIWLIWGEMPHKKADLKSKKAVIEKITEKILPKREKKKGVKREVTKKEEVKDIPVVHQPVLRSDENVRTDGALVGSGWNYWLENRRLAEQKNTVSEALIWNKRTGAFFDTPLPKLISGDSPVVRSRNLDRVVSENYRLMEEALPIRSKLEFQATEFSQKAEKEKVEYEKFKATLGKLLQEANPSHFDETWDQMITAEKFSLEYLREMQLRQQLVQSMGRYYFGLKDTYEMLMANRRAIIENIQVVNFSWDPFGRVISPMQWRAGQEK